jgi:hypothetical protein
MYALNLNTHLAADDGLEPLAPMPAVRRATHRTAGPAVAAAGGVLLAALIALAGPFAASLVLALGGTAALVYLGTAMVSGSWRAAALDLGAAFTAAAVAATAAGPAVSALLVHALWGILRGACPKAAPGHRFAGSWAAFHASAALLLGFGI